MRLQKIVRIGLALIGLALLAVSGSKILHFESFVDAVDGYMILPEAGLVPAAAAVIGAELVLSVGLCIPKFQRKAALGLIVLLLIFAVAVGSSLLNNMSIDCGCFGALSAPSKISWMTVGRNLAIVLGLCLALFRTSPNRKEWTLPKIKRFVRTHFGALSAGAVIAAMAVSSTWLIQNNHILALRLEASTPSMLLRPGDSVPPLKAKLVGGGEEEIKFSGSTKMVLIIFSPQCSHCQQAIEWWNGEVERNRIANNPLRVIGVSVLPEVPNEFMDRLHVSFPIYIPDSLKKFSKAFPARVVPKTLFINPDGRVALSYEGYPPHRTEF